MSDEEDDQLQRAVLDRLLDLHQATVDELIQDLTARQPGSSARFDERDAVERAIRDLARAGLVHQVDRLVVPSRPARRFFELWGG